MNHVSLITFPSLCFSSDSSFSGIFAKEWLRAVVAVLGIALGVAVVVSVQMANAGSLRGFETAIETLSGKAALEIVSTGPGLEETRLQGLEWLAEYGQVSPVLEGEAAFQTTGFGQMSFCVCWESTFFRIARFATIACWSLSGNNANPAPGNFSTC